MSNRELREDLFKAMKKREKSETATAKEVQRLAEDVKNMRTVLLSLHSSLDILSRDYNDLLEDFSSGDDDDGDLEDFHRSKALFKGLQHDIRECLIYATRELKK